MRWIGVALLLGFIGGDFFNFFYFIFCILHLSDHTKRIPRYVYNLFWVKMGMGLVL